MNAKLESIELKNKSSHEALSIVPKYTNYKTLIHQLKSINSSFVNHLVSDLPDDSDMIYKMLK